MLLFFNSRVGVLHIQLKTLSKKTKTIRRRNSRNNNANRQAHINAAPADTKKNFPAHFLSITSVGERDQKSARRERRRGWGLIVHNHTLFTLVITSLSQGHRVLQHHFQIREKRGTAYNTRAEQTRHWGTSAISLSGICRERTSAPVHALDGTSLADDKKNSSCKYFPQTPFGQAQNVCNLPSSLPSFSHSSRLKNYPKLVKSGTMEHAHITSPSLGDVREGQNCWTTHQLSNRATDWHTFGASTFAVENKTKEIRFLVNLN